MGIRPAVLALIVAAVYKLANRSVSPRDHISHKFGFYRSFGGFIPYI